MGDVVNTPARTVADKVMALVRALGTAEEPLRLSTLSQVSGTAKATTRRLLLDLCAQGYARSPGRGLYVAGPRLQGLAAAVVRNDPLATVSAETLGVLARATGHVAARVGVADGRAVVLDVENPQRLPIPLRVGDELPEHALWSATGTDALEPVAEYPTASTWLLAAAADRRRTTHLVLVGLAFLRPQDDTAARLLVEHARALGDSAEERRDVG